MDSEDDAVILDSPVKQARDIPICFHLPEQYPNKIMSAKGEFVRASKLVRVVDGAVDKAKNYHQYVVRCSPTEHNCLLCDKMYRATDNSSTNIINLHIRTL